MDEITLEKVAFGDIKTHKTVNTLTADENNYVLNKDNLRLPIQIQLPQKQKTFSQYFFSFLKSILHFKHFPAKDDPHS